MLGQLPKGWIVRRNIQYDVEAPSFYNLLWEICCAIALVLQIPYALINVVSGMGYPPRSVMKVDPHVVSPQAMQL